MDEGTTYVAPDAPQFGEVQGGGRGGWWAAVSRSCPLAAAIVQVAPSAAGDRVSPGGCAEAHAS